MSKCKISIPRNVANIFLWKTVAHHEQFLSPTCLLHYLKIIFKFHTKQSTATTYRYVTVLYPQRTWYLKISYMMVLYLLYLYLRGEIYTCIYMCVALANDNKVRFSLTTNEGTATAKVKFFSKKTVIFYVYFKFQNTYNRLLRVKRPGI